MDINNINGNEMEVKKMMTIRLNEIANIINNIHPMNVVNKVGNLNIGFYKRIR